MKLSSRHPWAVWAKCYLNGVEILGVQLADEEEGYVIQTSMDENGKAVKQNGEWVTQRRTGVVRLSWPEHPTVEADLRRQWQP
jgi:hypothetical protein